MLYLSRRAHQSVMIGDAIEVEVQAIKKKAVGLRITEEFERVGCIQHVELHPGSPYYIRPDVAVVLRRTRHGQVSLGFKAPRNVPVHRREVYDRIAREVGV